MSRCFCLRSNVSHMKSQLLSIGCQFDWYAKYKTIHNQVVSKIQATKLAFFQNLASS